jgi:hypothetical protein
MARSTGPILAVGAITIANESVIHEQPVNLRIVAATVLAAGAFALAERGWEQGTVALAWLSLVAVCLTRIDPAVPAPVESFAQWWQGK